MKYLILTMLLVSGSNANAALSKTEQCYWDNIDACEADVGCLDALWDGCSSIHGGSLIANPKTLKKKAFANLPARALELADLRKAEKLKLSQPKSSAKLK